MHDYLWFNCSAGVGERRADGTVTPLPDSAGIPPEMAELLLVVPFNDLDAFERAIRAHKDELAAVIVEPISYNQGCVPADPDFLRELRRICTETGVVLIFDEVLSGFRMCRGGAQEYFGVTPDLATLAKALGGGVPIAAVCGSAEVMSALNPIGHTIMSGTYTGHLTAVMAAIACQLELAKPEFYPHIQALADRLYKGIAEALRVTGVPAVIQGIGARFGVYFGLTEPVVNYQQVASTNREREVRFLKGCLSRGLYFHDYGHTMHHGFSSQHSLADIDESLNIIEDSLRHV
jgi:glutamate-1-semialdehyde 2,1-aminomutase